MKKVFVVLVVFSLAGIFSSSLLAQKRDFRPCNQKGFNQGRWINQLDLTDEQQETIADLRYEHQMQVVELRSKLQQNRLKLDKLFDDDNIDESEVMSIVDDNNNIHDQLAKSRMEMRIKVNSLLTPEQKAELKDRPGFGMGLGQGFHQGRGNRGKGFGPGNGSGHGKGQGRYWDCPNFQN